MCSINSLFTIVAPSHYDPSSESRASYPYDAEKEEILDKLKTGQYDWICVAVQTN